LSTLELAVRATRYNVLIVDDDPSHLEIYSLLLRRAGYEPLTALVKFTGVDFSASSEVEAIILDHRLNSLKTPVELATQIRERYPRAPILLISDVWNLPTDIAPHVSDFVRRGEPAKLLQKLTRLLSKSDSQKRDRSTLLAAVGPVTA
jgi:DNA-binding NtrC family response regulator